MAPSPAFSFRILILAAALPLLAGCTDDVAKLFNEKLGPLLGMRLSLTAAPAPKATPKEPELPSPDNRQLNADFIREMFRVVMIRDVRSREEFDKYMTMMDQGGHYEGIYNGVVYAADYKEKEKGVAPVGALKAYAEITAQLMLDQKYDSLKIKAPDSEVDAPADAAPPQPSEPERLSIVGDLEREAITKSTFTLKKLMGEQVLKTIELKKEYREKLATWYAHFTVALNKRNVDFGIADRNKTTEYFHYKWALDADEDRLKWECLNRIHRVMNAGAGIREPQPATQAK